MELGDSGANLRYHFNIETPSMAVSNRSMFVAYYIDTWEDDTKGRIVSGSRNTEDLAESQTELIGSNVLGALQIGYQTWTPCEGGYDI